MKAINRSLGLIGSLSFGAGLMYVFDPLVGRRRRAWVRDKVTRFMHKTATAIDVTSRDLKNRAIGLASQTKSLFAKEDTSDEVLSERVRSELGFLVSHPSSIAVTAEDGKVKLSGPIVESEVDGLLKRVSSIRGVKSVENRLDVHQSGASVPGLQGRQREPMGKTIDVMQSRWSPSARFLVGTASGASLFYAARRRDAVGAATAIVSAGILARVLANLEFKRLLGLRVGPRAIDIQKTINVAAPVENVFCFWTNYQNFPSLMSNVRSVRKIDEYQSHWVVAGPAGAPIEWDAIITQFVPNQTLAWETVPGSPIQHAGTVQFRSRSDGTTRLDIKMSYNPLAGGLGHAVASLFGADPKRQMDQDLMRMKSMIETGLPPHDAPGGDAREAYIH
jgi:uncharacterized membrane protein